MRKVLTYCLCVTFLIIAFSSCKVSDKPLPSLKESYRKGDKLPFGSFIAFKGFQHLFYKRTIEVTEDSFADTWRDIKPYSSDGVYSLYVLVTKDLVLSSADVTALMNYVRVGNDLFISADYIDPNLLDALYCNVDRTAEIISEVNGKMRETHVSMFFGDRYDAAEYGYYYFPFLNHVVDYDTSATRVLGVNEMGKPNFLVIFSGRGRVYLHVAPRIFSNYFLLTNNNFHYFENVISYLRLNPKNIYWDEYYKSGSAGGGRNGRNKNETGDNFSSLNVIRQHPPLLWAFSIALAGILIYILFNIKRKQRPIDIIKPNSNATVSFAETVGRLYFQHKNNRHIADKMITYFYEHIRNKYFINTSIMNAEFINSLAGKSGVPQKQTEELFALIKNIQAQENTSDQELMELNVKIDNFNKTHTDGRKFS